MKVPTMDPPIVECIEVAKQFGEGRAVDGVSLRLNPGEILVLVGPSGCGKTTLLRLIAGFELPDAGSIRVGGRLVAGLGTWVAPEARRVGLVFQDYALFPHMTVAGNVAFGLDRLDKGARDLRVQETLGHTQVAHLSGRYPHQLSGGEQQRVALARSVAPLPLVLLLDEPLSNLDPQLRLLFRREIKRFIKASNMPAIYVTHDQQEALYMGDQVAVMNQGRLEQTGSPEELYEHPTSRFTAEFLGPATFLKAQVTEVGFLTEVGLQRQELVSETPGESVEILVRPDDLTMTRATDGPCQVVESQFHGAYFTYTVRLPSGHLVQVMQVHTAALQEGDRVSIRLDPGHPVCSFAFPEAHASKSGDTEGPGDG